MEYLNNLYSLNANIRSIDLEGRELNDLNPLLPALARFSKLEELDLSDNQLTSLPPQLSSLKNLKILNLIKNQLQNLAEASNSLKTLPNLNKLSINLEDRESVVLILESLPKLKILNDQPINLEGNSHEEKDNDNPPTNSDDRTNFKQEQEILNMVKKCTFFKSKRKSKMNAELDKKFEEVSNAYLNREIDDDEIKNEVKRLKTKYMLIDLCTKHLIETQTSAELKNIWGYTVDRNRAIVESLCDVALGDKGESKSKKEINRLKTELQEMAELNKKFNEEAKEHVKDKDDMMKNFIEEKEKLSSKHNQEKKKLIQELSKPRKESIRNTISKESSPSNQKSPKTKSNHSKRRQSQKEVKDTPPHKSLRKDSDKVLSTKSKQEEAEKEQSMDIETLSEYSRKTTKFESSKNLSLRQMKELINDIYEQKKKHDRKCLQNEMPKETMEQYLYTYLNQQYGLRSLILEWTKAILEGIGKYSAMDSEILLFERILRNECEEGFHYVLLRAKNDIIEAIKKHVRNKRKLITEKELKIAVDRIIHSPVPEDIWTDIINTLCNASDRSILLSKILENSQEEVQTDKRSGKGQVQRKILFEDLQNIFLEYVLAVHEINISKFVQAFKAIDKEKTGTLNQNGFGELLETLKIEITPIYFEKLLEMLDPNKNQVITFSDCLSAFGTEQVTIAGEKEEVQKKKYTLLEVMNMNQS